LGEIDELGNQNIALGELNSEIDSLETKKYFSQGKQIQIMHS
jgi:hypothetical protein